MPQRIPSDKAGIRLIALDFDGTLVPKDVSNVDINAKVERYLVALRKQSVWLIIATGRHPEYIRKRIRKFCFDAIIGYSGNVVQFGNTVEVYEFSGGQISAFIQFADRQGLEMTLYTETGIACACSCQVRETLRERGKQTNRICDLSGVTDFLIHDFQQVLKLTVSRICLRLDCWERYPPIQQEFLKLFPGFRLVKTGNHQVEILAQNRSKASEILKLANALRLNKEQVATVGDDENDREMLEVFDHSYYVGDPNNNLRHKAAFCAPSALAVLKELSAQKGENNV